MLNSYILFKKDHPERNRLTLIKECWRSIISQGSRVFKVARAPTVSHLFTCLEDVSPRAYYQHQGSRSHLVAAKVAAYTATVMARRFGEKRRIFVQTVVFHTSRFFTNEKLLNTDHHIHFCYFRIRDKFCLEVTPRTNFIFDFLIENQLDLFQPQSVFMCN